MSASIAASHALSKSKALTSSSTKGFRTTAKLGAGIAAQDAVGNAQCCSAFEFASVREDT